MDTPPVVKSPWVKGTKLFIEKICENYTLFENSCQKFEVDLKIVVSMDKS